MNHNDNVISIEKYRRAAAHDDASAEYTIPLRRRTISLLQLRLGQCVVDEAFKYHGLAEKSALQRQGV